MLVAVYDVRRVAARWLALSYALGAVYFAIEAAIPLVSDARIPVVLGFATFLGATIVFNAGLAHKYDVLPPWRPMLAFLALATVAVYFVQDLPRHSLGRMMAYQLPFGAMLFIGALLVWSARKRLDRLDYGLMAILSVSGAHFIAKPFMAHALGGSGADPQAYLGSTYALFSQTMGTVLGAFGGAADAGDTGARRARRSHRPLARSTRCRACSIAAASSGTPPPPCAMPCARACR